MANKLPVKFYFNTMPGMPQITNQYGDMVAVLDCVLVNGTSPVSVSSITFADGVATVTCPAHGYIIDMVIEITGANQEEYNGEWRITEVSANTFKFVPVVPPAVNAATGTLKVRIPPLGYEIAFTATNKRVYRSKNPLSTRPYLRVDNSLLPNWNPTYSIISRVSAAAQMSDIDSFTDGRMPYDPSNPTINETITGAGTTAINGWFHWAQSYSSFGTQSASGIGTSAPREWNIIGDDMIFYFAHLAFSGYTANGVGCAHYFFGNYNSLKKNDQYDYILGATQSRNTAANGTVYVGTNFFVSSGNDGQNDGMILPKNAYSVGDHTNFSLHHIKYRTDSQLSNRQNAIPFPNGSDYSIRLATRYICDTIRGDLRGTMPGQYFIMQMTPFTHRSIINDFTIDGKPEKKKMLMLRAAYTSNSSSEQTILAYDIIGPWR